MGDQVIEVVREDEDLTIWPLENCCLCGCPTPFWYFPKEVPPGNPDMNDVACCTACAATATPEQMPSKREWCASERKRMGIL